MSLRAYQQAARRVESPREAEYRLFAEVTRALMDAKALPAQDFKGRIDALHWNRRLWAALADDCAQAGNALPEVTRGQIISLSLFVHRHTSQVMRSEADIEMLIDLNRTMMQGLATRPVQAV
jgi:flagellar biosynthesis activator protein FlaF